MQDIVVGIDTELPSRVALDWVIERTAHAPARVRLVTVLGDHPFSTDDAVRDLATAEARLAAARPGMPVETKLLEGSGIADVLAEEAANADLLVIGHHKARIMRSLAAGALPTQIALHARCPVVIVPQDWLRRFGKCVVGVQFDGSSEAAISFAAAEAHDAGRSLDIVHVADSPDYPGSSIVLSKPDSPDERSPAMAEAVSQAQAGHRGLAIRTFSVSADPDRVMRAHGREAALVVIGRHGRGAVDAVLRNSLTYNFMNWSKAPLCVVPAGWRATTAKGAPA
jgi:nucleotide-binding universal stress UspA family protein